MLVWASVSAHALQGRQTRLGKARPETAGQRRQPHTPNKAKVSKGKYSNPKPATSLALAACSGSLSPHPQGPALHITPQAE